MKLKRILLGTLLFAVVLILGWIGVIAIDYYRFRDNRLPLFAYETQFGFDGGTRRKVGFGYMITYYNQLPENGGRTDIVFQLGNTHNVPNASGFSHTINRFLHNTFLRNIGRESVQPRVV